MKSYTGHTKKQNQTDSHKAVSEVKKTKKVAKQNMTQVITQAAIDATRAEIMADREVDTLVNNAKPIHTVSRSGS